MAALLVALATTAAAATEGGEPTAMFVLAHMLADGEGGPPDAADAHGHALAHRAYAARNAADQD